MLFSILIPVYNVEKYLKRCLDSVLCQEIRDFEVILVNDGSTDCSGQICEEYAAKDKRIKYYTKKNEGLLLTRRFSLKNATGDYVLFLDSDDYWDSSLLKELSMEIQTTPDCDLFLFRYRRILDDGRIIYEDKGLFEDRTVFTVDNRSVFLKAFVSSSRLNTLWSKCVMRNVVDIDADYSLFKDTKGEDLLQSIALIQNSKKIMYLDKVLYNYRLSSSGRGRNFKIKYLYDYDSVRSYVFGKLFEMGCDKTILQKFVERYMKIILSTLPRLCVSCSSYKEYCKEINNISLSRMMSIAESDDSYKMGAMYIKVRKELDKSNYYPEYMFYNAKSYLYRILDYLR